MQVAVYGYGNLGRGVELAVQKNPDIDLIGIFTRRDPKTVKSLTGATVYSSKDILKYKNDIDVLIICGGSATDLPVISPELAANFNIVDSFDTHAKISEHFDNVDKAAKNSSRIALISCGWDPGMFSINRLYANAILPDGQDYTFWGRGVSQGHSDAVRRIPGVLDCRQYTIPIPEAMEAVRSGKNPELTTGQKHRRECFVVADSNADKASIENQIKTMPYYFDEYDTTVHFISAEEMKLNHSELPHGGSVIRTGKTGLNNEHTHRIEYSLQLDSNPEFTGSVLVAFARAVNKLYLRGEKGARTVFDIAPSDLSPLTPEQLRSHLL